MKPGLYAGIVAVAFAAFASCSSQDSRTVNINFNPPMKVEYSRLYNKLNELENSRPQNKIRVKYVADPLPAQVLSVSLSPSKDYDAKNLLEDIASCEAK